MKNRKSSTAFWVIRLHLILLLKILYENLRGRVYRVSYIESSLLSGILIHVIQKIRGDAISFIKIKNRHVPAGPVLGMAAVRNHKGEVVITDAFQTVQEIGSRLASGLMASVKAINPLRADGNDNEVTALFGMAVAEEINAAVMMALWIHWSPQGSARRSGDDVLVIPDSPWCHQLKKELSGLNVSIVISKTLFIGKTRCRLLVRMLKSLLNVLGGIAAVLNRKRCVSRQDSSDRKNRIMVFYRTGVAKNQRNDIPFFYGSRIPPDRLLIAVDHPGRIPGDNELEWINRRGIGCVSVPDVSRVDDRIQFHRPGDGFRREMAGFHWKYLKLGLRCLFSVNRSYLWFGAKYWHMIKQVLFWQHFFRENNVSILVHSLHSADNFTHCLGMARAGGIVASFERSILSDYGTYLHHAPVTVNFLSGPHSVSGAHASAPVRYLVQTGTLAPMGQMETAELDRIKKNDSVVLSVFDELPNDWYSGDSTREMYQGLFDLVRSDRRFILLVKSKKPAVMKRLPEIEKQMNQLIREGNCIAVQWEEHVISVATVSDIAVCVPSTAAFECVLAGKPTVLYNPMRSALSIFLKNRGWNRRYFVAMADLTAALVRFVDKRDDSVGDCSDLLPEIDPFRDGQGPVRVGDYLMNVMNMHESGMEMNEAVTRASSRYGKKWGYDKIRVNE